MVVTNPWHDVKVGEEAPEKINAIIEIPKGSQQKYELDKETGLLKLDRTLYSAVHYPGDYGFVPQTLWEDGDPLDVLILTSRGVFPMTLAKIRIIGVLRMIDDGEKDDKILAVYDSDPRFEEYQGIKNIPEHTKKEIVHFFETYKHLQGKECKIHDILDKKEAIKDIQRAMQMYQDKYGKRELKITQIN